MSTYTLPLDHKCVHRHTHIYIYIYKSDELFCPSLPPSLPLSVGGIEEELERKKRRRALSIPCIYMMVGWLVGITSSSIYNLKKQTPFEKMKDVLLTSLISRRECVMMKGIEARSFIISFACYLPFIIQVAYYPSRFVFKYLLYIDGGSDPNER